MNAVIEGKLSHSTTSLRQIRHITTREVPPRGPLTFLPSSNRRQERQTITVMEQGVKVLFESHVLPIDEGVDMALDFPIRGEQPCPNLWIAPDENA